MKKRDLCQWPQCYTLLTYFYIPTIDYYCIIVVNVQRISTISDWYTDGCEFLNTKSIG